jgi:hypothetical protein
MSKQKFPSLPQVPPSGETKRTKRQIDLTILNTDPVTLTSIEDIYEWDKANATLILELANHSATQRERRSMETILDELLIDVYHITSYPLTFRAELLKNIKQAQNPVRGPYYIRILKSVIDSTAPVDESVQSLEEYKLMSKIFGIATNAKSIRPVYDFIDEAVASEIDDSELSDASYKPKIREALLNRDRRQIAYLSPANKHEIRTNGVQYIEFVKYEKRLTHPKFKLRNEIRDPILLFEDKKTTGKVISASEIPYFFVLVIGGDHAFHVVLLLLIKGILYSVGLGYQGDHTEYAKINNLSNFFSMRNYLHLGGIVALYTSDFLLDVLLKNRIVDFGIFTSGDANRLDRFIQQATGLYSKCQFTEHISDDTNFEVPTSSLLLPLPWTYSTISSAREGETRINCTSFISRIFPHIHSYIIPGIVHPKSASVRPSFTRGKFERFLELYKSKSDNKGREIIELLGNEGTGQERKEIVASDIFDIDPELVSESTAMADQRAEGAAYSLEDLEAGIPDSQATADYTDLLGSQVSSQDSQNPGGGKRKTRKSTFKKSTFKKSGAKYRRSKKHNKTKKYRKSTFRRRQLTKRQK